MINIDLTNKDIVTDNTSLFQWDYGQKLAISGLRNPENIQVHFARTGKAEIRIGTISENAVVVDIPDTLLQKSGMIKAYIYLSDSESGETIKIINLNVREREQPTDYTSPDYVDVVADINAKLNRIIETGIAQYEPDPALVDILVTEKLNAIIGNMATKDEVAKTDLTSTLVTEIDGKLNASKVVTNLAVTEYGFVPDAKTVSDAVTGINNNLVGSFKAITFNETYVKAAAGCNNSISKTGKLVHINATFDTVQAVPAQGTLINLSAEELPNSAYGSYITAIGAAYVNMAPMSFVLAPGMLTIYSDNALPANTRYTLSLSYRTN